jgi:hypothetical protein
MPPTLQLEVRTTWAENDNGQMQQLPEEVSYQILCACEDFLKTGKPVIRDLKFSYISAINIVVVQEPNKATVLDCTNLEKVVSRRIELRSQNSQECNIFELLQPPQHLAPRNYQVDQFPVDSPYYQLVRQMFYNSQPHEYKIQSVSRLQNLIVQERFKSELAISARKYPGKSPTQLVKLLWHGSKHVDSEQIYKSEEGLDMRYSRDGMYGQGIYFADNARYSH